MEQAGETVHCQKIGILGMALSLKLAAAAVVPFVLCTGRDGGSLVEHGLEHVLKPRHTVTWVGHIENPLPS